MGPAVPYPGSSVVQQCLRVPELQHIVFDLLHDQPEGPSTLAALARTARFFQEVALDTLWNAQSSLVPLVRCFPPHLWTESRDDDAIRVVSMVALPTADDWTRVKLYASRIRILRLGLSSASARHLEGKLSGESYVVLKESLGLEPFLPNLHSFEWAQSQTNETHDVVYFQLLLNPRVSTMELVMKKWSDKSVQAVASALNEYRPTAHHLRSITFTCPSCPLVENAILALAQSRPNLQDLVCTLESKMSLQTVTYLSKLNSLQRVAIHVDRETAQEVLEQAKNTSGTFFSALHSLALHTESLEICEDWLSTIRSPCLDCLSFIVDEPPKAATLHDFLVRLASRVLHSGGVRELRFVSTKPAPRMFAEHTVTPATLEPLLPLDLVALRLESGAAVDVDDAFIERASRAWRRLRVLELGAELRRYVMHPRVTLTGLLPLAENCPDMEALALPFVADASAYQSKFDAGDRPFDGLSFKLRPSFTLGVGGAVVSDDTETFILAGVLSDLCPGLKTFQTAWDRAGKVVDVDSATLDVERQDIADRWRQVDRFVVEMARVRRQERMWLEWVYKLA
ncbi:hypothetical protein C8Q77DRAFT_1124594 [Trametes polyzona]|nr:hypothetical protein C8Q77DRAFT_1124594 [Trametes polyzona]